MNDTQAASRSVVTERDLPYPPEKVWRALTQPHLIAEWLMKTDFEPTIGRRFGLHADWGSVDCEVRAIEPNRTLTYSWNAMGLESVVTYTLTPSSTGTHLRVEQTGFKPDQEQAFRGAQYGWPQFLGKLEKLLAQQA